MIGNEGGSDSRPSHDHFILSMTNLTRHYGPANSPGHRGHASGCSAGSGNTAAALIAKGRHGVCAVIDGARGFPSPSSRR